MSEQRDAYVQKMKAKLDEWNAEIDRLAAKAEQAEADARIEYQGRLQDLRARRKDVEDKLATLRQAGEGAWEDVKAGIEISWEALNEALQSARSRFK